MGRGRYHGVGMGDRQWDKDWDGNAEVNCNEALCLLG